MRPNQIAVEFYGKPVRTVEGFLDVPVVIAKKMVMSYEYDDGNNTETVNELLDLPYDDAEFVASCNGLPFVLDHPTDSTGQPVNFTPENYQKEVKGIIIEPIASKKDEAIYGKLRIWDNGIAEMVENGEIKEVSQGYESRDLKQSGTHNGENYAVIQRPEPFNHLALVSNGRGGEDVRILYNSKKIKSLKLNSEVALELYDKFLKGEINRMKISKRNEGDKPDDKPDDKKPEPDKTNEDPMLDAQPEPGDKVLTAIEGLTKIMGAIAQKMGIGGEEEPVINADDAGKTPTMDTDKIKEEVLNKVNADLKVFQMQAYKDQGDTLQRAALIIGSDAPGSYMKFNSDEDFKRHIMIKAGRDEATVKKYNSMQVMAHYEAVTDEAKTKINAPRGESNGYAVGEISSQGAY